MSKIFYRYIRPAVFNITRAELETNPRGGICLRFEKGEGDLLYFSHSRCDDSELFSKAVAKNIADRRAIETAEDENRPTVQASKDTRVLVEQVIEACQHCWEVSSQATAVYRKLESRELAAALEKMMLKNYDVKARAHIWRAGIAATGTAAFYSNCQNKGSYLYES